MNQLHLIAAILFGLILGANAFSYKDAKNWGKKYPQCNRQHQSPIIINGDDKPKFKKDLRLKDFTKSPTKLIVKNTGHTVEIKAKWSGDTPRVTGGPLMEITYLRKPLFIGPANRVDMEMHHFFYRKDLKSFKKAETQKGGLAVLKVGLMTRSTDDYTHSFDDLEKNLYKVRSPNSTTEITPFLILHDYCFGGNPFLFYEGSLDYPPCSNSVTWFICNSAGFVTDGLVREFKKIKLAEGDVSNVRPARPQNKTKVQMVFEYTGKKHLR